MNTLLKLLLILVFGVVSAWTQSSQVPPQYRLVSSNSTVLFATNTVNKILDLTAVVPASTNSGNWQAIGTNSANLAPEGGTATMPFASIGTNSVGQLITTNGPLWNVLAHGAVGDGTTDDTAATKAANDAAGLVGGTVYFPGGHTYLLDKLVMTNSNVRWLGDGANNLTTNCSIIKAKSLHGYALNVGDDTAQTLSVVLENLVWDGNGTNADFTLILGGGCEDVVVRKCLFFNGNRQLLITGGTNNYSRQIYVENCQFQPTGRVDLDGSITVAYPASGANFLQTVVIRDCSLHTTCVGYAIIVDGVGDVHFQNNYFGMASGHGMKFQDTSTATGHSSGGGNGWGNTVNSHDSNPVLIESSAGGWDTVGNMMPGTKNIIRYKTSNGTVTTNQSFSPALPTVTTIPKPVIQEQMFFSSDFNNPATPLASVTYSGIGRFAWLDAVSGGGHTWYNSTNAALFSLLDGSPVTSFGPTQIKDFGGNLKADFPDGGDIALHPAGQVNVIGTNYARVVVQTTDGKSGYLTVVPTTGNVSLTAAGATSVLQLAANGFVHFDLDDVGNVRALPKNGIFMVNDFFDTNAVTQLAFLKNAPGLTPNIQAQNDGGFKIQAVGSGIVTIPTSLSVGTNVDTITLSQGGTKILTAGQHITNIADIASSTAVAQVLSGTNTAHIGGVTADNVKSTNAVDAASYTLGGSAFVAQGSGNVNVTGHLVMGTVDIATLTSGSQVNTNAITTGSLASVTNVTSAEIVATNGITLAGTRRTTWPFEWIITNYTTVNLYSTAPTNIPAYCTDCLRPDGIGSLAISDGQYWRTPDGKLVTNTNLDYCRTWLVHGTGQKFFNTYDALYDGPSDANSGNAFPNVGSTGTGASLGFSNLAASTTNQINMAVQLGWGTTAAGAQMFSMLTRGASFKPQSVDFAYVRVEYYLAQQIDDTHKGWFQIGFGDQGTSASTTPPTGFVGYLIDATNVWGFNGTTLNLGQFMVKSGATSTNWTFDSQAPPTTYSARQAIEILMEPGQVTFLTNGVQHSQVAIGNYYPTNTVLWPLLYVVSTTGSTTANLLTVPKFNAHVRLKAPELIPISGTIYP